MGGRTPFDDVDLRNWLFPRWDLAEELQIRVLVEGSGPFEESEFARFLTRLGMDATPLDEDEDEEVLVVGSEDWSTERLVSLLQRRLGGRLRVYSQEMLLAYIITEEDPFAGSRNILEAFAESHPAIEFLRRVEVPPFRWPEAVVVPSGATVGSSEGVWGPDEGLLSYLGYRVGAHGIRNDTRRRQILARAFKLIHRDSNRRVT